MNQERTVLIVSRRPENRKTLLRVFDELSINSYVAPTIRDAIEVLASRSISIVFCEEQLPDGLHSDLLTGVRATWPETQFIVMLCTGEWEEYLQAMRLGAQEVLRCPLRPTDIDLALIQAKADLEPFSAPVLRGEVASSRMKKGCHMKQSDRKEMSAPSVVEIKNEMSLRRSGTQ